MTKLSLLSVLLSFLLLWDQASIDGAVDPGYSNFLSPLPAPASTDLCPCGAGDGTLVTQSLLTLITTLKARNQQLETLAQSCSRPPSSPVAVGGGNGAASSAIDLGELSQLVSQGSLTISQLTTVLTAMGIRQDLIRLIISGGNVDTGLLQQIFAQYHVTASQVQVAMIEAGVNSWIIGLIVHHNPGSNLVHYPSFEHLRPVPGNGNGNDITSMDINWAQLSQLVSQGSLTISQLTTVLTAMGIRQDLIRLIISGGNVNMGLLQQVFAQYHVTASQVQIAMTEAGVNPVLIGMIVHSKVPESTDFFPRPSFEYPIPSYPGPGSHNGNDAIKYINWDQLSQLLSQGSVTISQLTAALNAVGINQDVINVIIRNNSINFELLQHFLTQYHVTMSQLEVALIRAGINPSYVFPIFHSGPSVIYPNPSIPPQQDEIAGPVINWGQFLQLMSQGSLTMEQVTAMLTAMGISQEQIKLITSGSGLNTMLLQQLLVQYHVTVSQMEMAMARVGVNPTLIYLILHPNSSVSYPAPSSPARAPGYGMAATEINWHMLSYLISQGSVTMSQFTSALQQVGISQEQIKLIISGNNINTVVLLQLLAQYHVTTNQFTAAMMDAGADQQYIEQIDDFGYLVPEHPTIENGEPASTAVNWSQLQQLLAQGLISVQQMQIVFQRIGLSDSQIQMIMTGSSINVALLKQILNTQNVMWGAISSAMLHAGISYQYFYVIHHKEESGVTLLPGWPGTLPELKPEGCDNHPPNDDNGNVSMIVGTNTNGTRPIDSSQFPGGAGTLPILKPEVPPNHPPNDGNGNVSTIVAPNTNGTRPIDTIPLPGGPGTLPDLKPEVPPPNETSSTNTGSALPPGVSCPPGKKPGATRHYFKTSMDDNSDDDWSKNWYARYKQLLAYVGDKAKIDANIDAMSAYNDLEYWLRDNNRTPKKWNEWRKDYYNRWMEQNLNKLGEAMAGSKWKTFQCGAGVNGFRGDCGMLC